MQVKYLAVIPLIAAELVKKGDFLAPSYPNQKYGYGCVLYDHLCSASTSGALSLQLFLFLSQQHSTQHCALRKQG